MDEASAIANGIWEATDGCMTDKGTQRIWCVFGNPNLPEGRFKECFPGGAQAHIWKHRTVDSRTVSFTDKEELNSWVRMYGEDSDFVRVRVRGVFPRAGSMQFIPEDVVVEAFNREVEVYRNDPFVIGVDVARFGDDASVIYFRKGRDGRTHPPIKMRGVDTMTLAGRVAEEAANYRADAIFIDGTGVGGGVVDRLRQLRVHCFDINFGSKPDRVFDGLADGIAFANKRAEMWGSMREWLKIGAIQNDPDLRAELIGVHYAFTAKQEIQLERKEDMKKRGLASPDIADALALTFAYFVMPNSDAGFEGAHDLKPLVESDYDPYDKEHMAL
jgi:hypothetical protein